MTLARPMFPPHAESVDSFSRRLALQERKRQKALQRLARLRKEAFAEIDRLIAFIDASDPYVMNELEEQGDDEPSLGLGDDRELDECDDEDGADDEPSLGSLEGDCHYQETWSRGDRKDLEDEHDGREPSEDDEPSLGSFEGLTMDQEVSYLRCAGSWTANDEDEEDPAESGIGDQDGMDEQVPFSDWQMVGMV